MMPMDVCMCVWEQIVYKLERVLTRTRPCLILHCFLPDLGDREFQCFEQPRLWYLVTAGCCWLTQYLWILQTQQYFVIILHCHYLLMAVQLVSTGVTFQMFLWCSFSFGSLWLLSFFLKTQFFCREGTLILEESSCKWCADFSELLSWFSHFWFLTFFS